MSCLPSVLRLSVLRAKIFLQALRRQPAQAGVALNDLEIGDPAVEAARVAGAPDHEVAEQHRVDDVVVDQRRAAPAHPGLAVS